MSTHTPGPWDTDGRDIHLPGGAKLCIEYPRKWYVPKGEQLEEVTLPRLPRSEREANARLIAAAPEMLKALEGITAAIARYEADDSGSRMLAEFIYDDDVLTPAYAAIRQARGDA